ncbi:MAG TPA: acetate--CoA ligase family protein [Candidatus Dormibacteraeota bacterium]|nr:acetate--CoA ligase family protein [Candidatus Dormibacteraeota bacterium]
MGERPGATPTAPERLAEFLRPRSVALVGATDRSMWSYYTFQNLRAFSPDVPVHCIHPRHDQVHGQPVHRSLRAIGGPVDLAYVMVPTDQVVPVLEEAADVGIRNAVVLTAGFAEAGPDGRALEADMVALARERDMLLLGPNGNGFINAADRVAPYGLPIVPPLQAGPLGIVLQSGGLASVVLHMANSRNVGVSRLVATGNEAMVTATDVFAYLVRDDATRAVAAFLESIRDPERFRQLAREALEANKAVVVMKVGRSAAGQQAALAHTGAVVGDVAVARAALRQLGVVQVDSLEDLLVTAGLLAHEPRPLGRRLAAVTASGGACDIIADRATDEGLELPEFPPATTRRLTEVLPAFSNPRNPLDVTGYVVVDATISSRALEAVVDHAEGTYDTILYQATVPQSTPLDPALVLTRFQRLRAIVDRSPVPVVIQSASSTDVSPYGRTVMDEVGLYLLNGIEHGMTAIGRAVDWHERRRRLLARPAPSAAAPADSPRPWPTTEAEVRRLLQAGGVPVVPVRLAASTDEAVAAAVELGFPAVLKVASPDVLHKSDVGGVALDLRTPDDIAAAYARVTGSVARALPEARLEGVLVSPQRAGGVELLVSVRRDRTWGPVLAVGLGGVWVEALRDVSLRLLPVTVDDVVEALGELRGAALLGGARGRPAVSLRRVADVAVAIAGVAEGLGPALDTLEVNPLWAAAEEVEVLDALVTWQDRGD